jgi:3-phosphoshikimate 1-carboxyvinyltransferase
LELREIIPLKQRPNWVIKLPGSKSITNRALLCAVFAKGRSRLYGALKFDDSNVMISALRKLGVKIKEYKDFIEIFGTGGKFKSGKITLDLCGSGTATRFLTAAMVLRNGETIITGDKRMQERPIADLVDGLRQLGVSIEYLEKEGCPPIRTQNTGLRTQRMYTVRIRGDMSSQFVSALLMIAPMLPGSLKIEVIGNLVSRPYIDVTMSVMKQFGIKVRNDKYRTFYIKPQRYKSVKYTVEGDASAASYWTSIAYLHNGKVRFENLSKKCVQGDIKYEHILKNLKSKIGRRHRAMPDGVKNQKSIDMSNMPDTAMTLAVTAPFIKGRTKITGLSTLRIKETDRLSALEKELRKIGVRVKTTDDSITIKGLRTQDSGLSRNQLCSESCVLSPIKTYNDHRMAMCFAVIGTMIPGVVIEDPGCTKKTYPDFWKDLESAYLNPIKLGQKNLVLTGMRCSGKTHLGKKIARLLKRRFIDLDTEIGRHANMRIYDIVKRYGWPYFRKLEQKMCSDFGRLRRPSSDTSFSSKPLVISAGGGVILNKKNMKNLKKNGVNIFVFADPSKIVERIKKESKNRPTLTGKGSVDEIHDIWEERRNLYLKYADIVWDNTSGEIVDKKLEEIFS